MKHFLFFISACIGMVLFLSACEKDDQVTTIVHGEPCIEPEQSIHEMKDWYYFKTGTYWVYREQYSGQIDTISVYEHFDGVEYSYWYFFTSISHQTDWRYGFRVDTTYSRKCWIAPNCKCHTVFLTKWRPNDAFGVFQFKAFSYPNYVGNYIYSSSNEGVSKLVHYYDKLSFGNFLFTDVIEWNIDMDYSENEAHTSYLIAKNIGIIERINHNLHEDWRLIDYHVIQ